MIPFNMRYIEQSNLQTQKSRMVGLGGWQMLEGEGNWEFNGYRISVFQDEKVWTLVLVTRM